MLDELRKGSANIIVKALLLVVVLSFIIWGVGDMFRGRTSNDVAEIGNTSISLPEFEHSLRQEIRRIQSMTGGNITSEQILAMQIDRMVLSQLINARLIELEARSLGINIGNDIVQGQVMNDPTFRDKDGKFDKKRFLMVLKSNNLTEKKFVDLVKKGLASDFLIDGITSATVQSDEVVKTLYAFRNEKRKVDLLTLTKDNLTTDTLPTPTDADLMDYYNKRKNKFAIPEYRALSYVTLKTDDVASSVPVNEEDLKKIYEEQKEQYQVLERRDVDNMLFSSEEEAKVAWERLNKQEDFYAVAKELTGAEQADADLGLVSKGDIFKDVADTVFSLAKNSYSAPVKGPFGWYIFRVRDIKPASKQSFEEVRDQIAAQVKSEKAGEVLYKQVNDIEDAFASGSTLEEVAKTYHLEIKSIDAINREGKSLSGEEIKTVPGGKVFLNLAFETNQGEVSPMTITPDNSEYIAVRVDSVTDPRVRALDEVKATVQELWKKDKQKDQLKNMADKLAEDLKKGVSWQDATKGLKVQIETGKIVGRSQEADDLLPLALQDEIFKRHSGEHTKAYPQADAEFVIALVREVVPATKDDVKMNVIKQEFAAGSVNDLLEQYNMYLRGRYPVSVNDSLLKKTEQ